MSKYLNVPTGNYQVIVQEGGRITLDTGNNTGLVYITGDLAVQGNTTYINTTETTFEDNIITINRFADPDNPVEPNFAGIQGDGFAGIEIERGSFPDAFIGFDENINWIDPGARVGAFVLKDENSNLLGLRTNSITTGSNDLFLISNGAPTFDGLGNSTGGPVVTVTGVTDYEKGIWEYDNTGTVTGTVLTPDALVNAQSVVDWVNYNFASVFLSQIGDGTVTPSSIVVSDEETSGSPSVITFSIDNQAISRVYGDRWEFDAVRLEGTKLETIASNEDLILSAPGVGSVRVDDTLHINSVPGIDDVVIEPSIPDDGVRIYVADQYTGKTGIYFVNQNQTRDELVSKNRSLLFSMIF